VALSNDRANDVSAAALLRHRSAGGDFLIEMKRPAALDYRSIIRWSRRTAAPPQGFIDNI
jgi:hypothetical protein